MLLHGDLVADAPDVVLAGVERAGVVELREGACAQDGAEAVDVGRAGAADEPSGFDQDRLRAEGELFTVVDSCGKEGSDGGSSEVGEALGFEQGEAGVAGGAACAVGVIVGEEVLFGEVGGGTEDVPGDVEGIDGGGGGIVEGEGDDGVAVERG